MKISLVQENPIVGDIGGNTSIARDYILKFESSGSDLIVFSELFITGYPPEDLLLREDFLISAQKSVENLSSTIKKSKVLIGLPTWKEGKRYNSAALLDKSGIIQSMINMFFQTTSNSMKRDIFPMVAPRIFFNLTI